MTRWLSTPGGRKEGKKAARAMVSGRRTEHTEQTFLVSWARTFEAAYPELRWLFSIPNGAKLAYRRNQSGERYSPEANKLKAEGMLAGVSDLFLSVPKGGSCGLYIEMKWGRNRTTPEQDEFIESMRAFGYRAEVCYGALSAIRLIVSYLSLPEHIIPQGDE